MEKLKVLKENVLKAYEAQDANGKKLLVDLFPGQIVPISIHVRIAAGETITFDDILADQKTTAAEFADRIENDTEDEAAYKRAKLISLAINKTPLTDSETWYTPYFYRSGSGVSLARYAVWDTHTSVGARLCGFRNREDAIYAGKTFNEIYKPLL